MAEAIRNFELDCKSKKIMDKKIAQHLSKDPVLKKLIEKCPPPDFRKSEGLYPDLLRSIVGQQLSGKAAETIHGRFLNLFEDRIPRAKKILNLDLETLRGVGLSRQKASYVQNVSSFFQKEKTENSDLDDVLPLDDLGIRNGMIAQYDIVETGKALKKKLIEVAELWRPYRSYACWYMWRSLE